MVAHIPGCTDTETDRVRDTDRDRQRQTETRVRCPKGTHMQVYFASGCTHTGLMCTQVHKLTHLGTRVVRIPGKKMDTLNLPRGSTHTPGLSLSRSLSSLHCCRWLTRLNQGRMTKASFNYIHDATKASLPLPLPPPPSPFPLPPPTPPLPRLPPPSAPPLTSPPPSLHPPPLVEACESRQSHVGFRFLSFAVFDRHRELF